MMSFAANLSRARSHIIFVLGLLTASALIVAIEEQEPGRIGREPTGGISPAERRAAAVAWAQLPERERTPHLRRIARELGVQDVRNPEATAETAAATLNAIHAAHGQER